MAPTSAATRDGGRSGARVLIDLHVRLYDELLRERRGTPPGT